MSSLSSQTHDSSFVKYHISGIQKLGADLDAAVKAAWPTRESIRYSKVQVLLLSWEKDDLGVAKEIAPLRKVFEKRYHFHVHQYLIPSPDSETNVDPLRSLNRQVSDFLDAFDQQDTLIIVYYAGHASQPSDAGGQSLWSANRVDPEATLPSRSIQSLFETSVADVLILLDCCYSAATPTTSSKRKGKGVVEVIAACGYESIAAEVGQYSLTRCLIDVLALASGGVPFSIGELHSRILRRLKSKEPELLTDIHGNHVETPEGQLIWAHQPGRTPIYSIIGERSPRRSIILAPLKQFEDTTYGSQELDSQSDSSSLLSSSLDTPDASPSAPLVLDAVAEAIETTSRKRKRGSAEDGKIPYVLLAVQVEGGSFKMLDWVEWIRNAPTEAKDIHIEGKYDSYSTLIMLRMPVTAWNLLPDNPAYRFVGFVTSRNEACKECCSSTLPCRCANLCSACNQPSDPETLVSLKDLDIRIADRTRDIQATTNSTPKTESSISKPIEGFLDSEEAIQQIKGLETNRSQLAHGKRKSSQVEDPDQHVNEPKHPQYYPCQYCRHHRGDNGFRRRDHLAQHMRNYHQLSLDPKSTHRSSPGSSNGQMHTDENIFDVPGAGLVATVGQQENHVIIQGNDEKGELPQLRAASHQSHDGASLDEQTSTKAITDYHPPLDSVATPTFGMQLKSLVASIQNPSAYKPPYATIKKRKKSNGWRWSCCHCSMHHYMDMEATPACPECSHWRCMNCAGESARR